MAPFASLSVPPLVAAAGCIIKSLCDLSLTEPANRLNDPLRDRALLFIRPFHNILFDAKGESKTCRGWQNKLKPSHLESAERNTLFYLHREAGERNEELRPFGNFWPEWPESSSCRHSGHLFEGTKNAVGKSIV